ncbi:unnamed protein product, partial [Amoebophrya sp. A25]|eukprot:GSA25T00016352001.1
MLILGCGDTLHMIHTLTHGLGKTLTLLALVASQDEEKSGRLTVIVVQKNMLSTWEEEVSERLSCGAAKPKFELFIEHDNKKAPRDGRKYRKNSIILTTYETYAHRDDLQQFLAKERNKPHRVILDEAHKLGNRTTSISKTIGNLNATCKWAVSGTPMRNKVEEIFGILRFLRLKPLDDYDWFHRLLGRTITARTQ